MSIKKVALIGAGNMGSRMAKNVHKAGFDLMVCDQSQAVLDEFASMGVKVTKLARDCASADAVIVLVANDQQILSVTTGPDGVGPHIPKGHSPIICMMSTTLPATIQQVAKGLEGTGARLIDAPVSGGLVKAEQGTLTIMMGGDDKLLDDVTPLMKSMGESLFRCGGLGSAEVVKVINNMIGITNIYITGEAMQLAAKSGVDFDQIASILDVSTGRNFLSEHPSDTRNHFKSWARTPEAFDAFVKIVSKDLHLALSLGESVGYQMPLLEKVSASVDASDDRIMNQFLSNGPN